MLFSLLDASIDLAIDSEGVLNAQQLFSSSEPTDEDEKASEKNTLHFSLAKIVTKDIDIHLTDNTVKDGVQHYINDVRLEMERC